MSEDIGGSRLDHPASICVPYIAPSATFSSSPIVTYSKTRIYRLKKCLGAPNSVWRPTRQATVIFTVSACELFGGRIRSLECRVVRGKKGDSAQCSYVFVTPPNSAQKDWDLVGATSITDLAPEEGEDGAAFEARREAALLQLVETKLAAKHALGSARSVTQPSDVTMMSPRADARAASRSEAEAHVCDPPESRNRSSSSFAQFARNPTVRNSGNINLSPKSILIHVFLDEAFSVGSTHSSP